MKTVSAAIKTLMQKEPYYGLFAMTLNKKFSTEVPTAGVRLNGINFELLINKDWWYSLPKNIQVGLIKHELLHICFEHYKTGKDYADHDRFNQAADYEINSWIGKDNLPEGGCFVEDQKWEPHKGTRYYYNQIGQQDPQNSSNGQPIDDHSGLFQDYNDLSEAQQKLVGAQRDFQMKQCAEQVIKSRGTIPGELSEMIDKLFEKKKPVFNWKAFFRRLLGVNYDIYQKKTRRKESNRFEDSFGLKKRKKHKILVAIDTSGSVDAKEFQDFFSEIYHIHKAGADIHIIEADIDITNEYDYKGKMPDKISGRGGTSFIPCVEYYNQHRKDYTVMVYFTDGYGDQSECHPNGKMIWIITSNGYQESEFPGFKVCIPKQENNN